MLVYIVIIVVSFFFSSFFSGVETAFTSLSRLQQHVIIAKYPFRGAILQRLLNNPLRVLTTVLIGNTTANASFSITVSQFMAQTFENFTLAFITGIVTFVLLVFCEITPKQFCLQFNEMIIARTLVPLYCFQILFFPFSCVLNAMSSLLHTLFSVKDPDSSKEQLSRKNLASLFYRAHSSGELERENTHTVTRVLGFSTLPIESVMVHRKAVTSLSSHATVAEVEDLLKTQIYSFYPVYEKDILEDIIGIVSLRDLLTTEDKSTTIRQLSQKALFIQQTQTVSEFVEKIKNLDKLTLAILLDEYGGFSGVVSMKDIIHYVFDIDSKHRHSGLSSELFMELDPYRVLLDASVTITELEEHVKKVIEIDYESNTVGGYIAELTQTLPLEGNVLNTELGTFKILRTKQNRVSSLLWTKEGS